MLKAFVVKVKPEKDLSDVCQIARSLGQQAFRTKEHVQVKRVYGPDAEIGFVVVVEGPDTSCSKVCGVADQKNIKNG